MAGGNGSCVGGWIPTSAAEATSLGGFDVNDVEKQFGTIFTPGRKFYSWYKCNGIVSCNGTGGFAGNFSPIPQKPSSYASGNPIGFASLFNHRIARVIRKPLQGFPTNLQADVAQNGLYLDLTGWTTSQTVNVKFTRVYNNSGHFLSMALYGPQNSSGGSTPFTSGYTIRGQSDEVGGGNMGGTRWAYFDENTNPTTFYLKGGMYYMFRSRDHRRNNSGVYQQGEDQGGGAGTASYFGGSGVAISIHDNGACCGDNNQGGNTDFGAKIEITGWS